MFNPQTTTKLEPVNPATTFAVNNKRGIAPEMGKPQPEIQRWRSELEYCATYLGPLPDRAPAGVNKHQLILARCSVHLFQVCADNFVGVAYHNIYNSAMKSDQLDQWRFGMDQSYQKIQKLGVWKPNLGTRVDKFLKEGDGKCVPQFMKAPRDAIGAERLPCWAQKLDNGVSKLRKMFVDGVNEENGFDEG